MSATIRWDTWDDVPSHLRVEVLQALHRGATSFAWCDMKTRDDFVAAIAHLWNKPFVSVTAGAAATPPMGTRTTPAPAGRFAFKCLDPRCPDRKPVAGDKTPTCYTCGTPMTMVS